MLDCFYGCYACYNLCKSAKTPSFDALLFLFSTVFAQLKDLFFLTKKFQKDNDLQPLNASGPKPL